MGKVTLADLIQQSLFEYQADFEAAVKRAIDQTAEAVSVEIKRHVKFENRTGKYIKAFAFRKSSAKGRYSKTWYVRAPYYRLTHLLEHGHATRDGGRTRAYPHIAHGAELAEALLPELIEQEMNR